MLHIQFPIPDDLNEETLASLLHYAGYEGSYVEDNIMHVFILEEKFDETQLKTILADFNLPPFYTIEKVVEQNWNKLWETSYEPVLIKDKIYVRAPFHPSRDDAPYELIIMPKMSFGTAHHATTSGMLEMMLNLNLQEKKILDVGTGTGILAIFACQRGAHEIWACDIDEWSISNARENFDINQCPAIHLVKGTIQEIPENNFDIILANINKNVLLDEIPFYAHKIKPGGILLLSGFLTDDLVEIDNKCTLYGLELVQFLKKDDWIIARFDKITVNP